MASKDSILILEADPNDSEDRPVSLARLERAAEGQRIRMLRRRLGMSQAEFAKAYGIPLASIRQYEIGRNMPPPAVRAYLKVIEKEPEATARALAEAA